MRASRASPALLLVAALAAPLAAGADEGMWTFDAFPREKVEKAYGFRPTDAWLEHVRLSSARLARGCSASFVSRDGLVMTNHHCAHSCIEQLSTAARDYVRDGFQARSAAEELRCPDVEVNQLVAIRDVTADVRRATAELDGKAFNDAQREVMSRIEKACQTSAALRCEVVTLYHGGLYHLYTYRRFQDVRLVFAPEFAIAFFGGDPDNFTFPRYDLDVAFLRVYDGGRPARMDHWFRWSAAGPKDGELTFVSGNPGATERFLTVSQLEFQRDVALPDRLLYLAEERGMLAELGRRGPEEERISTKLLFSVENAMKALRGRLATLQDRAFFESKVADERALRADLAKRPGAKARVLPAFDAIARAEDRLREIRTPLDFVEHRRGFQGELFRHARTLVRAAAELPKPSGKRLREFRDSALPALEQALFSRAPLYPELEIAELGWSLGKLREALGPDDPLVRKVLGTDTPYEVAARAVRGSRLLDPGARRRLWDGGERAVAASDDAMIALARLVEPGARALRKEWDDAVEPVLKKNGEIVAQARFDRQGAATYPDATFTARLSYGRVKGYEEKGRRVPPFTTLGGAFERATGKPPFALPPSWIAARPRLDLAVPLDMATTNDIIGGNSGSPVVDARAEIVGLVFDGNLQSLGGDYGYDETANRTVAVTSDALLEALAKVYGAERLVRELMP